MQIAIFLSNAFFSDLFVSVTCRYSFFLPIPIFFIKAMIDSIYNNFNFF